MQKLQEELKNVPRNASLVPCSTNSGLNKVEKLSDQNIVLTCNNLEVNQRSTDNQSLQLKVFVLSLDGKPLMPTKPARARKMLQSGKAKVIKRFPFTIQLNFECENKIQNVVLGIDTGYGNIGFSARTEKSELISGTLKLDGRTSERLKEKSMYRRGRRNKLWYRRWKGNRNIPEGWLAPSVLRRYQTHLNLIEKIKKLLPVRKIVLEIAKFDIQKMENPAIEGKEYQQGNLYDYQSIRAYLMSREKGLCEHCKKNFKDNPSHIHHRKPKSKKGSDRLENLMLVHKKCHETIHKNPELLKKYQTASTKEYKQSAFMNIINKRFYKDIPDLKVTYGNITFVNRNKLGLEKTHYNDAFVISGGTYQERTKPFTIVQKHRNNRVLQLNRKGFKPSIRKQRYNIQPKDLVKIDNRILEVIGSHCKGTRVMIKNSLGKSVSTSIKKIDWIFHNNNYYKEEQRMHSSPA